jgi:alpha-D-xyloside xylohydrolase
MRFFDGNWLLKKGVSAHYACEAYDAKVEQDGIILYCPDRPVVGRASTIDGGLLTIRISSPAEGVAKVKVSHFEGGYDRKPSFALVDGIAQGYDSAAVSVGAGGSIELKSGAITVRVHRKAPFRVEFLGNDAAGNERLLTWTGEKKTAWMELGRDSTEGEGTHILEQLALGVGERVYGLGERFTPFVKNGQTVDIWNEDGGTSSEQSYKNIPFYLTSSGYGVLVNHPGRVSFEVGSERVTSVEFSVPGEELEYYVIAGSGPKDVLRRYSALTGLPALPPAWSFGLWLTTSFTTSYDEKTVMGFLEGMAERDLPLRVFHFDCFWMKEYHLCDLEWDRDVFPDPKLMLSRIKKMGVNVCVWINPYIAQRSKLFAEGRERGYLVKNEAGDVWQWDRWQAGMGLVDFTNPDAAQWYADKLRALVDMGVDTFKTDFGERIPLGVRWFDGSDPSRMHNYYTLMYNALVFKVLEEKLGHNAAVVFARSATVGGQKYPVHWGGDCSASFESMAESLRGGLSLCLSGFGFWSHDIGGFEDHASAAVYKRWVAFGLMSSHSRLHGSREYKVPWLYDEEACDVLRFFTKLKCSLMPYIFAAAAEAARTGVPIMRAMMLEFPSDETCGYLDRQYMLGGNLLVAPVFSESGEVSYYLPEGRWTKLLPALGTGANETVEGGRWMREKHGFMSMPLLVRPNSILAFGSKDNVPDYEYAELASFHIFEPLEGEEALSSVTDLQGKQVLACRSILNGKRLSIRIEGRKGSYKVVLRNQADAKVPGGKLGKLGYELEISAGEEAQVEL